jgi:hypothetical protein
MHAPTDPPNSSLVELKSADGDSVPTLVGRTPRTPVAEALALAAGSTLGHFEVIAPLGAGGMASVLKARDTHLGRLVALKILPPEAARDHDAVTRFKQEARAAAKLDHENVARVFFSGEDRGLHFIAFEFVEGETLRARIERLGRLTPAESVRFLLHCASGLRHLNDRGVVHRDIKPSNVVVTPDGRAKLIDLGLARHAESVSVNGGVTQSGMTLGTFDYISPEQARDPRTADVRSDIYSLGCTFYHALTGRPPVPEGTAAVKLSAQQLSSPTDPRELNPDVSDELAMVLNRMLGKDPGRRYQTPTDLIADLTEVARQLGVAVERSAADDPLSASSATHPRFAGGGPRLPVGWIVAGVVVLAAGLVVASLTGGPTPAAHAVPWDDPPVPKLVSPFDGLPKEEPPPKVVPPTGPRAVATAAELVEAARGEVAHLTLTPGVVYDLSDTPGVFFDGRRLTLECANPRTPAVVRVAVSPLADPLAVRAGGFTVRRAEAVAVRGVRFEFTEKAVAAGDEETLEPVGVAVGETAAVDLQDCAWDESDGAVKSASVTALHVGRSGTAKPTAFAARRVFFGTRRWTAVEFAGPVIGTVTECGFATGKAAVRLSAGAPAATPDAASALDFKHCTFLLDHRAAAVLTDAVKATVAVGFCVFAAPAPPDPAAMMFTDADRKPVALRSVGGDPAAVAYSAVAGEPSAYFRTEFPVGAVGPDSVELVTAPWKAVPPTADKATPWKVLELNPAVRAVRVSRPQGVHILGATRGPTAGRLYADWPPGSATANSPKPGVKVWYPNPPAAEKAQLPKGVYDDLQKAIDALRADDVLQIRGDGDVKVPAVTLTKVGARVTIQPHDGFAPVLVPAADGPLFRVEEGELRLERLHVRLTLTDESTGLTTAAVALAGGKRCVLADCTVTADDTVSESSAVVLVLPPAGGTTPDLRPEARFEKCLIRGTGRLVRMPAAAPATVSVTNSVVALSGPVLDLGPPDAKPAEGAAVRVKLSRVTTLLAGPLVDATLTDTPDPTFVPVQIDADTSLFAPLDKLTGPLLRVTHGDSMAAGRYVTWSAFAPNRFANFPPRAVFVDVSPKRLESADWLAFSKEKKAALVSKLTFANPPAGFTALAGTTAADLVVTDALVPDEYGAKPGLLPIPPAPSSREE